MSFERPLNRRLALGLGMALFCSTPAWAQNPPAWPTRPIKLVVPGPAGSGMDIYARMLQAPLQAALKQPVVIDNKAGANSIIGNDAVAKSKPDGYTFLFTPSSAITLNPIVHPKMPYDTIKDLLPVAQIGQSGILLVVHPSTGFKSLKDMIQYAILACWRMVAGGMVLLATWRWKASKRNSAWICPMYHSRAQHRW